jgi:hypothetical protein
MCGACGTNKEEEHTYWWKSQREIDHGEEQDVGRWITLRWILRDLGEY